MKQEKNYNRMNSQLIVRRNFFVWLLSAIGLVIVVTGCKKELQPGTTISDDSTLSSVSSKVAKGPTIVVQPGSSIQAAVNIASPGSVIKIKPGTYAESISINKADITLMGEGNVIIQNPGGAAIGITVDNAADGFTLKNITLRDFGERAVNMTYIDGFLLSHVTVINSGEFGLFVEYCKNGVIEHCVGSGLSETAFFVGYSKNILVTQNKGYGNVIGFESENSSYITFEKNQAYNNTVGIMCLLVPGRDIKTSNGIIITRNQVHENNLPNFSEPPEKESVLPSGIGILVIGTDNSQVKDNHVTDHKFTGVAVVSSLLIAVLSNLPPEAFADIEPNPDGVKVIGNKVEGNGFNPPSGLPLPGVDLLWDGSGSNNCWRNNLFATSYPFPLPACQ
ncbi:MAG TPA: right-handed parallel beta-helix repeat-containing protein [Flavisolibacter sp.]|nr:right-handed parallel beta-helix repeat-containing protein [Flavisolibacter sp.]